MRLPHLTTIGRGLRTRAATLVLRRRHAAHGAPRKIVIHIGAHKTGSSVVQSLLKSESRRLRWRGFGYERAFYRLGRTLAHQSPVPDAQREILRREVCARLNGRPEPTILASSESFFGDPFASYANIRHVAEDLRSVLEDWPVHIVACIRRQDEFIESLYHQHVKQGGALSFERFVESHDIHAYRWDELLREYAQVFGRENLTVCSYDVLFRKGTDVIAGMFPVLRQAGFRTRARAAIINPSLSQKGLDMALRCNELLTPDEQKVFRRFLEQTFPRRSGEPHGLFTASQRDELLHFYAPSNLRCFDEFLPHALPADWLGTLPPATLDAGVTRV